MQFFAQTLRCERLPNVLFRAAGAAVLITAVFTAFTVHGQSTQGLISGVVRDSLTDQPIGGALASCTNLESGLETSVNTDGSGAYSFPPLSPGRYLLKVQ